MSRIRGADTRPEKTVRALLRASGIRYRLNVPTLPGRPDVVVPKLRVAIFVHGCFWHHHDCTKGRKLPMKNRRFWKAKIMRNAQRDAESTRELEQSGWRVVTIWECELKSKDALTRRLGEVVAG